MTGNAAPGMDEAKLARFMRRELDSAVLGAQSGLGVA